MTRNKKRFAIFLVLLTILAVVLVGCTTDDNSGGGGGGNTVVPIDLEKILANMQDVLGNTQKKTESPDTLIYSVDSEYSLDLAEFKYTITLNANFDEKNPAESTIYFKVFDDEFNMNRVMTYFTEGTLYLDILGAKSSYPDFGSSSMFKIFYNSVRSMDLSRTLFSDEIISIIGDIVLIKPYIDESNIIERNVGEHGKYYEFKDINLDSRREEPNKLLKSMFAPFGDKIDALTEPLFGIPFSRLSNVQIGTWTVDKLSVASDTDLLKQFDFGFSGMLDSRETYDVTGSCVVGWVNREITPSDEDNPFLSGGGLPEFADGVLGNYAFTGTLTFNGMAEANYDVDILLKTDENNNDANKLSFLLNKGGSQARAASAFYVNGSLYTDLGDIMTLLGNGFGLSEMGFPKVKTAKFNMSQAFGSMLADLEQLLSDVMGNGSFQIDEEARDLILKKISSDKDGYFNLVIDKELVTYFAGGEQNVVEYIAKSLGIEQATAERYFRSEVFDKIYALVRLNVTTKNLVIVLNDGTDDVVTLSLYPSEFDEARLDRNIAEEAGKFNTYNDFITPEDIGVRMEGSVTVSTESDFSKFFGAFIGDSYGKNTPVGLSSGSIGFRVEALNRFDGSYQIHAKVWRGAESADSTYFELWALEENGIPMLYIDYKMLGFKFRIPAEEVRRALSLAVGEDSILVTGDLMEIFSRVLSVSQISLRDDGIFIKILPANEKDDPLFDILNIRGLTATATTAVQYSFDDSVFDAGNLDEFIVPELETLPQQNFNSLYDAEWIEKIRIKDFDIEMYIPYDPDSIRLEDGKTVYVPRGKLFGREISYYLTISGGIDGTKEVVGIKNDCLTIDPWAKVPLKDTIEVQFKDGSEGRLPFVIEGFSESLINPQGMDRTKFRVRFGTDKSILKKVLDLDVEVEIRTLDSYSYSTENDLTIVGENNNVNPLAFFESPFEILPEMLELRFRDIRQGATQGTILTETFRVEWEYDYAKQLSVTGGSTVAKLVGFSKPGSDEVYDIKPLGYRIVVQPKQFDYIQVMTERGKNIYTVDVLSKDTYRIPSISTAEQEIRIYFTDGTYSTVGGKGLFEYDSKRNSFLTDEIDWLYKAATNISENGSVKPLGSTNMDTATYSLKMNYNGIDLDIAEFLLKLEVREPAAGLVRAGTTTGVIANAVDGNSVTRTRGNFDYHAVDFGSGYGVPFRFDPYAPTNLPSVIKVKINTATVQGDYNEVERIYPVRWQSEGNIVSEEGLLLYPSAEDMNFRAIGQIGDGNVTLELSVVVDNVKSVYRSVKYYREYSDGRTVEMDENGLRISAYEPYLLPNLLVLTLENGMEVRIRDVQWNWSDGTEVKLWSEARFNEYSEFLSTGKGNFDILEYYNNPSWDDGVGYRFDNRSETYGIEVSVKSENSNIYENTIGYEIGVTDVNAGRVLTNLGEFDGNAEKIDPYHQNSAALLSLLTSDRLLAPVRFADTGAPSYFPVVWEASSLSALIARLESGEDASAITLNGTIFKGVSGMEQSVSGVFSVIDKSVSADADSVKFPSLMTVQNVDASYSVGAENGEKVLNLQLKRPYALFTAGGTLLTPSEYLKNILGTVNLVFLGGTDGNYVTRFDFLGYDEKEFNKAVLNFANNVSSTDVQFVCYFTAQGSTKDHVLVKLNTTSDTITETGVSEKLDRFQADGSRKYADGYALGDVITVTFTASGRLTLPVETWTVSTAPSDASISAGSVVKTIPSKEFEGFGTRIYKIVSALNVGAVIVGGELRDTVEILFNFEINAADVRGTAYRGESVYQHNGAEYRLNIVNGVVVFDSVFDYYGFLKDGAYDVSKMPSKITPNVGSSYGQSNTFDVRWSAESVPADFNAYYSEEGALAATAVVYGYGDSSQTLRLYVRILQKEAVSVSKDGFDFASDGAGGFILTIDPYAETDGFAMWETTLPSTVDVGMADGNNVTYSVAKASYKSQEGADFDPRLLYDYKSFESNDSNTVSFRMILEDGTEFPLTATLIDRTVKSVSFPYQTSAGEAYSENKMWIDPYGAGSAVVPETAIVNFANGTTATLPVRFTPVGEPLSVKYTGGEYLYQFALYGYRNDENGNPIRIETPQTVDVSFIVIPRILKTETKTRLEAEMVVDDGIAFAMSDITVGKGLTEYDFVASEWKNAMPKDFVLTVPEITKWYTLGAEATANGMLPGNVYAMEGFLSDRNSGESVGFKLKMKTMLYDSIGTLTDGNFTEANVIRFDVFNAESVLKRYYLKFIVSDPENPSDREEKLIEFDTLSNNGNYRIWWPDSVKDSIGSSGQGGSPVTAKFYFGNPKKEWRVDGDEKTFYLMQIDDIAVNFGYNTDTLGTSGKSVFVYDPLNPVFPTTAVLTGVIAGERVELGEQNIDWNGFVPSGSFYYETRQHSVVLKSKETKFSISHYVEVLTLDRTEFRMTSASDITNEALLDPAEASSYDQERNEYVLPRELTMTFSGTANVRAELRTALSNYGQVFRISNARWWLGRVDEGGIRKISLEGNEGNPWPMVLVAADFRRSDGEGQFSIAANTVLKPTENREVNPFRTKLTVKNRSVLETSVTGAKQNGIFRAEKTYALDPYNVAGTLPKEITVSLGGELRTLKAPVWNQTGEILNEMIEGSAAEEKNYVSVELQIFADKVVINFPVKARPLSEQGKINGGTFYVNYGTGDRRAIFAQLPKQIYFNFGWKTSENDYTAVPLQFSESSIPMGSKLAPGVAFEMEGVIGVSLSGNPNFICTVIPVSPRLYALANVIESGGVLVDYTRLDYWFDEIPVPVNSAGNVLGLSAVKSALPSYLWLGDGIEPVKILQKDFVYAQAGGEATEMKFSAAYSFRTTDSVNPYLAVDANGGRTFAIEFNLPLKKYDTSSLLAEPYLDDSGRSEDGFYHFALGNRLNQSSLPNAIYNQNAYGIYWDFANVRVNAAGGYTVEGKLIVSEERVYTFTTGFYIDPIALETRDIFIEASELKFTYSGEEHSFNVQLSDIIKEDGIRGKPSYYLSYARQGTTDFIRQPYLDAGNYIVRVTIDDRNATGSRDFEYEITKWRVTDISWSADRVFEYSEGVSRSPSVVNLPNWVLRTLTYLEIDGDGFTTPLPGAPINAGRYSVSLSIPEQDNCEATGEALAPVEFTITKKNPNYKVETSLVYNGFFRHVPISGLPQVLESGMSVSYTYYQQRGDNGGYYPIGSDMIRNAGNYMAVVTINGGRNYVSVSEISGNFTVGQATLTVTLSDVESYYLQSLLPFTSGVRYSSPFGTDTLGNFSGLVLTSEVTERSVPGRYPFSVGEGSLIYNYNGDVFNNYRIEYVGLGTAAYVVKMNEGVKLIQNKAELDAAIQNLKANDSVSFYLEAGNYGEITLNVAADVTLTGCYGQLETGEETLAVSFDGITVNKGALKLDLIAMSPKRSKVSLTVGYGAGDVSIQNSLLKGDAGQGTPSESTAVYAERGYAGVVALNNTTVSGYAVGVSLESGKLLLSDSEISSSGHGVLVQNGDVTVERTLFRYNSSAALVVNGTGAFRVTGSRFVSNGTAVRYMRFLTSSELEVLLETGENVYSANGNDVVLG